ncbi:alpha/beta fold hydrolase [Sphingomonas sp. RS2018]
MRLDGPLARRHQVRLRGDGRKLVMFAPGFGTDQTSWTAVLSRMGDEHSILLFDVAGAGPLLPADFNPTRYQSLSAFADDLLALLEELDVERLQYVGHSVSGMIGVLAAIENPGRFERLVLLNASPRYLDDEESGYRGGFTHEELEDLIGPMTSNYQAWVTGFATSVIGSDTPSAIANFSAGLRAMRADVAVRILRVIFESDVRELLPLLTVPTALIHSRDDIAVPETVALYLHRHLRQSSLTWIDAIGHLPHLTDPDKVAVAIQAQLAH